MTQFSLTFDKSLLVRDDQGRYVQASAEQILVAAREVIQTKFHRGASFTSTDVVKEYLSAKLVGLKMKFLQCSFWIHNTD